MIKEQEKELKDYHNKYINEHEKLVNFEKECNKLKFTVEKLHETMKVLNEEALTWKERTLSLKNSLETKEKEFEDMQNLNNNEKAAFKRVVEKYEENLRKFESKEKKWMEIYE